MNNDWIIDFDRRFGIDNDWDSQLYHYLPDGLKIANKEVKDFIATLLSSRTKLVGELIRKVMTEDFESNHGGYISFKEKTVSDLLEEIKL